MESDLLYYLIIIALICISLAGSVTNLLVIVLISRNKKLWNRQTLLVLSLACADLAMALAGVIPCIVSAVYREWIFGHLGCQMEAFMCSFVGIGTKCTLTVLAVDRFLMVKSRSQRPKSAQKPAVYIMCVWTFAFVVTSPPFFGWGRFAVEAPGISCSIDWQSTSINSLSYIIFLMLVGFIIPLIVVVSSYVGICLSLHQASKHRQVHRVTRAESRATLMVAVMVAAFLVTWVPYSLMAIVKIASALDDQFKPLSDMQSMALYLPALLAKSSIIYNPIIYAVFNTQFKAAWKDLFSCVDNVHLPACRSQQCTNDPKVIDKF